MTFLKNDYGKWLGACYRKPKCGRQSIQFPFRDFSSKSTTCWAFFMRTCILLQKKISHSAITLSKSMETKMQRSPQTENLLKTCLLQLTTTPVYFLSQLDNYHHNFSSDWSFFDLGSSLPQTLARESWNVWNYVCRKSQTFVENLVVVNCTT